MKRIDWKKVNKLEITATPGSRYIQLVVTEQSIKTVALFNSIQDQKKFMEDQDSGKPIMMFNSESKIKGSEIKKIVFCQSSAYAIVLTHEKQHYKLDMNKREVTPIKQHHDNITCCALHNDGNTWAYCHENKGIWLKEADLSKKTRDFHNKQGKRLSEEVTMLRFDAEGKLSQFHKSFGIVSFESYKSSYSDTTIGTQLFSKMERLVLQIIPLTSFTVKKGSLGKPKRCNVVQMANYSV